MRLHAYACETRPVLQGGRLTTWELKQANIDVTLITDNTATHAIQTKEINAIIVSIELSQMEIRQIKIGTMNLAILAKHFNILFYVAAPLSTFDVTKETELKLLLKKEMKQKLRKSLENK